LSGSMIKSLLSGSEVTLARMTLSKPLRSSIRLLRRGEGGPSPGLREPSKL